MNSVVKDYFNAFSNKDLSKLSELYREDVVLWEWGQRVFMGKQEVLDANQQLFDSSEKIAVLVQGYAESEDKFYVELGIMLEDKMISVLDVITVKDNKIISVQAYRGF